MTRSALIDSSLDPHGGAWLAELSRRDRDLDSRLYWREQRPGFGLGQQSASETNMQQLGLDALSLSDALALSGGVPPGGHGGDAPRPVRGRVDHRGPGRAYGGLRWAHDVLRRHRHTSPQVLGGGSYDVSEPPACVPIRR
jgi:hypothetical protein